MKLESNWICLGRILKPHGIRGSLNIKLDNPNSETLRPGLKLKLQKSGLAAQFFEVESFHAGRLLQLKDVADRTLAEKLTNSLMYVSREDFPKIASDEIYLTDMIGFEVFSSEGEKLGIVEGFTDNSAQTILEVRSTTGGIGLIPFVKPLITKLDADAKKIIVDLPNGLFTDVGADD